MTPPDDLLPIDPPILVGGGGSALIWIRKDQEPELVDHKNYPYAKKPKTPDDYFCYKVKDKHLDVVVNNGVDASLPPVRVKNDKKHHTLFK